MSMRAVEEGGRCVRMGARPGPTLAAQGEQGTLPALYSSPLSSLFFLARASARILSEQAGQMVGPEGLPQTLQTRLCCSAGFELAGATVAGAWLGIT
jgi:hypothetical protein